MIKLRKQKYTVKPITLTKFLVIALIKKLLEMRYDSEEIAIFLEDLGANATELLYVDSFEYVKPSRAIYEFINNIKTAIRIYLDVQEIKTQILLNTEAKTLTISFKFINPLCEGFIAPNVMLRPGIIITSILRKVAEIKKNMFHAFKVIAKERQCTAIGDEYDEYILTFFLSEKGVKNFLKEIEPNKWIEV